MSAVVFDIETVPNQIAIEHGAAVEAMAAKREMDPSMFASLCPSLCRIVAIGMKSIASGGRQVLCDESALPELLDAPTESISGYIGCGSESDLLAKFHALVAGFKMLLTFNGRGFDIPTVITRSVVNGVKPAGILLRAANAKPWESGIHCDVMNMLTFGGAGSKYPLQAYALGFGLADPKAHGDGGSVSQLVRDGQIEALCRYVMADVDATEELYRRWTAIAADAA